MRSVDVIGCKVVKSVVSLEMLVCCEVCVEGKEVVDGTVSAEVAERSGMLDVEVLENRAVVLPTSSETEEDVGSDVPIELGNGNVVSSTGIIVIPSFAALISLALLSVSMIP